MAHADRRAVRAPARWLVPCAAALTAAAPAWAQAPSAARGDEPLRVSLRVTDFTLGEVLDLLTGQFGLKLVVQPDVDLAQKAFVPQLVDVALADALRVVLTPLRYSFRIEGALLIVFARETRTFAVRLPVLQQDWHSQISNAGGSSSGGGESSGSGGRPSGGSDGGDGLGAKVEMSTRYDSKGPWTEIEQGVKGLMSPAGSYSISRVVGSVTVTDTPAVLTAVDRYIATLNQELSRTALVEVKILEVALNDTTAMGIDWDLALRSLSEMSLLPNISAPLGLTQLGSDQPALSFSISSSYARAVIRAVEEQGNVNVISQPSLVVNNGLASLIQVGQVQTFVNSLSVTQVANAGTQTSIETGVLSDGVVLALLPRINGDGSIVMGLSVVLQDIMEIRRLEMPTGFVELPRTARRSYVGVNDTRPGRSLVIGGLLSTREVERSTGIPFLARVPIIGPLFGGYETVEERVELVVIVTVRDPPDGEALGRDGESLLGLPCGLLPQEP